jgi:hypothetical protein
VSYALSRLPAPAQQICTRFLFEHFA